MNGHKGKLTITPKLPKGEDGYKIFSIRVKNEVLAELENISSKTGRSRNELVGMSLEYALHHYEIIDLFEIRNETNEEHHR